MAIPEPTLADDQQRLRQLPDDLQLRERVAEALHAAQVLPAAEAVLTEGLRRAPDWLAGQLLLGIVFADLGRFAAAAAQFRRVTALAPEQPAGWANLGAMLKVQGRCDAALKAYDRAVALAPRDARIRVNRTVALLHAGRLQEAWAEYEWRQALPEYRGLLAERRLPPLAQCGDLAGRSVLVTHEEGFGDTLQFMRYVPLLAEHGAHVLAWVPRPLVRIVTTLHGVAGVLNEDDELPAFDYHCPFVSLPCVFGSSLASIPRNVPYIAADPALAQRWQDRLPGQGWRVGLVWAGQGRPHLPGFDVVDGRRSMTLDTLAPLGAVPDVHFVSLQLGPAAEQARTPPATLALLDPMGDVADFADTAAIVSALDAVVSVDTSVAHLAGALGRPVLLLDRYDNCWRWLSNRTDSPWYPGLRIFRQKRPGEWGPVVTRVARALAAMARHPSPARQCRDAA